MEALANSTWHFFRKQNRKVLTCLWLQQTKGISRNWLPLKLRLKRKLTKERAGFSMLRLIHSIPRVWYSAFRTLFLPLSYPQPWLKIFRSSKKDRLTNQVKLKRCLIAKRYQNLLLRIRLLKNRRFKDVCSRLQKSLRKGNSSLLIKFKLKLLQNRDNLCKQLIRSRLRVQKLLVSLGPQSMIQSVSRKIRMSFHQFLKLDH